MTYSVLGWILEVSCKLVEKKKFINRGFLIGPYCPIYGWGALIMTLLLKKYLNDIFTLFIMNILICSILEYFTSYFLEVIFKARWWDYSNKKFNINGRICLETMIPFGLFGLLVMYVINPIIFNILNMIPISIIYFISIVLFLLLLIDTITSYSIITKIKNINKETQSHVLQKKDNTENITSLVKKELLNSHNKYYNRLINSFPHIKFKFFNKK
jgi:uncharacterized membrane protein